MPISATDATATRTSRSLPLHGLASLRILIVALIGIGYASTMGIGQDAPEWGRVWGYDPSWYGIQILFILSGFLAIRSMADGRSVFDFFRSRLFSLWPALIAATLVTAFVLYPLMCVPSAPMSASERAAYVFKTVFLIDPGARMPGVLDDAKYMCLMQGAIWTLRWGLLLHIGFLIGWKTGLLQKPRLVLAAAMASIVSYVLIIDQAVADPAFGKLIEPIIPGLRLGYAYLVGVAVWHWQGHLRLGKPRIIASSLALAIGVTAWYFLLPWSAAIELIAVSLWLTLSLGFLVHAPKILARCPRLAPVFYVTIWPAAQIVTAVQPGIGQLQTIEASLGLAALGATVIFLLLRQARIQPARF